MEYFIIIMLAAVAGYFYYKKRPLSKADVDKARDTYVCNECGETYCECHKEKP